MRFRLCRGDGTPTFPPEGPATDAGSEDPEDREEQRDRGGHAEKPDDDGHVMLLVR